MMRRSCQVGMSGLLWMALLSGATEARAEPPPAESVAPTAAAPVVPPGTGPAEPVANAPQQQAEALLAQAKEFFRTGEYRQALPLVERAYALTESPRFLFNLGVLHHKLSECVPARDAFELYLHRDPAGEGREQALAALDELRARCPSDEKRQAVSPSPLLPPPAPSNVAPGVGAAQEPPLPLEPQPLERSWAPGSPALLLLGVGAAAGIGALVSLAARGHAQSEIDELGLQTVRAGGTWDEHEARRRELAGNARLYRGLALGLGVASAAFLGAGTTVWILEAPDGSSSRYVAAGVNYCGRF